MNSEETEILYLKNTLGIPKLITSNNFFKSEVTVNIHLKIKTEFKQVGFN